MNAFKPSLEPNMTPVCGMCLQPSFMRPKREKNFPGGISVKLGNTKKIIPKCAFRAPSKVRILGEQQVNRKENFIKIYFVGGASGSAKTAVMPDLKKIVAKSVTIYNFDDIGVPQRADTKWHQDSTERWLQTLVTVCLLEVNDFERIKRLKKRNTYGMDQNILNWSSWLCIHHEDPQWEQQVLKEGSWPGMDFSV